MALEKHMLQTHSLFEKAGEVFEGVAKLKQRIAELKAERDAFEKSFNEMTEEFMKSQRALWLARAKRAEARKDYWYARCCHEGDDRLWSIDGSPFKYLGCIKRTNFDWLKIWSEVECKCLKKAEKYK